MRQAIVIFLIFAIPKMKGSWMTEYCKDKRKTLESSKTHMQMKFLELLSFPISAKDAEHIFSSKSLKRFENFLIEQRIIENLG